VSLMTAGDTAAAEKHRTAALSLVDEEEDATVDSVEWLSANLNQMNGSGRAVSSPAGWSVRATRELSGLGRDNKLPARHCK
jgi:hypothetical protein